MDQWLEKRAMTKLAGGMTADQVIREFDDVMVIHAQEYVNRLWKEWGFQVEPGGGRAPLSDGDWHRVMNHIKTMVPTVKIPSWSGSAAYRGMSNYQKPEDR